MIQKSHRSAKTVDAAVGYQDPKSGQKFISMINQTIYIDGFINHLLCPLQCHLNVVQISEFPKFLGNNPSETTHALDLVDPFDALYSLIIRLQLTGVTSYFDVYSPSVAKYENNDIPKTYLTAEEPPWDPSMNEYSERETNMLDHQGHISIPATAARGSVFVMQFSHTHWLTMLLMLWIMTILQLHLQPRFRKPSVEPIVLAKRWGITPEKAQKTIQATSQRGIMTILYPSLSRRFRIFGRNLRYCLLASCIFRHDVC